MTNEEKDMPGYTDEHGNFIHDDDDAAQLARDEGPRELAIARILAAREKAAAEAPADVEPAE